MIIIFEKLKIVEMARKFSDYFSFYRYLRVLFNERLVKVYIVPTLPELRNMY